MIKALVAIVGRPNVGKSALFNRMVGEQLAIVDSIPGTTRDRLFAGAEWSGVEYNLMDTGGLDPTHGGKEPLSIGSADYIEQIRYQAEIAIREADVVLFVVDASSGVTPADKEVAQILRSKQKKEDGKLTPPILLVVNKADNKSLRDGAPQFFELGMGEPHIISALHGTGTGDMLDALVANLPQVSEEDEDESIKVAIVGKTNVGKSSLLNRILGEERTLVSPIAGTTRDAVDTFLEYEGIPITLIDTAGIRRRGKIEPGVEKFSVIRSMRAIDRAEVVLLVIDAEAGITAQDAHIAGYILDALKSTIIVVNKWDAIEKDQDTMVEFTRYLRKELNFLDYVPVLFISAKTGKRVEQVIPMVLQVQESRVLRVETSKFNQILLHAQDNHPAPSKSGRSLRLFYGTQVKSDPPTFLIFANDATLVHFSYRRYLENQIRLKYPFLGTPIQLVFKSRRSKDE